MVDVREGTIDELTTCEIQFNNKSTGIRWLKAHADFDFKNRGNTVTITDPPEVRCALGSTSVVVGNVEKWNIRVATNGPVQVGIALASKTLDSNDDVAAFALAEVTTTADTLIEVCLLADEIRVIYKGHITAVDITHLTGQTIHPLLSTNATVSATIETAQNLSIYVDKDGVPCIDSSKTVGVPQVIKLITGGVGLEVDGNVEVTGEFKANGESVGATPNSEIPINIITAGDAAITGNMEQQAILSNNIGGMAWSPTLKNAVLWTTAAADVRYSETGLDFADNSLAGQLANDRPWYVFWADSVYVAVGFNTGELKTSTDGLVWSAQAPTGLTYRTGATQASAYAFGKIYLAVENADVTIVAVSSDLGATWSTQTIPLIKIESFAYNPDEDVLVAVGFGDPIYTTDGITWTRATPTGPTTFMTGLVYNSEMKKFIGFSGLFEALSTFSSVDGATWERHAGTPWTLIPTDITYAADIGLMIVRPNSGIEDEAHISRNGIDWKKIYIPETAGGYSVDYIPFWGMVFYTIRGVSGLVTHTPKRYC